MQGLMMDYPLTLTAILGRAERIHGRKEVVSRRPDRSLHRTTYADIASRARKLAVALSALGVRTGDRVATLCWNQPEHLELYFGVPALGAVIHTLNPRLHAGELSYIVHHADDKVLVVDETLLPVFESFRATRTFAHVILIGHGGEMPDGMLSYAELVERADAEAFAPRVLDETDAAAMCYTSGTTGRPKGVVFSHRALVLHSLGSAVPDAFCLGESDVVLPVVPMFHANAWGIPFAAAMVGAKQVYPGPHLDGASLLELLAGERVTFTAGVPTIWIRLLQELDRAPGAHDLSRLKTLIVGGSAAPKALIEAYERRHGLKIVHAWGMTEMSPLGTVARLPRHFADVPEDQQNAFRAKQGIPVPFVEIRARGAEGLVPWDGQTMGELEVRGPWVARAYYNSEEGDDRFTADGWFKTGDIVTIDALGCIEITDRAKDLIRSGGEWISSVALENALMAHPAVAEAAVIAVPDPQWQERPLAVVVLKSGQATTQEDLLASLAPHFPTWWLPDTVEFVEEIPKTAVGKFKKAALRERFNAPPAPVPGGPDAAS
ncbi:MAG: long-chain fatty acid--CoA ligase [candidate division NC10 bacterium]|nr:long-chain fatty acid--CoA ligase [candidate division NC10 bacterium]MBI2163915.1 long-chain fatty acid--CoA ligase [candidate division NC10 bacterium]MBI3086740.1 long-chain fatty acid--CoA ligase [candidate division NC10 bacterium]